MPSSWVLGGKYPNKVRFEVLQWHCWRFISCGMLGCVFGWKDHSTSIFTVSHLTVEPLVSFELSRNIHPTTQHPIWEDLNLCPKNSFLQNNLSMSVSFYELQIMHRKQERDCPASAEIWASIINSVIFCIFVCSANDHLLFRVVVQHCYGNPLWSSPLLLASSICHEVCICACQNAFSIHNIQL